MTGTAQFVLSVDKWVEKAKAAPMLVIKETIQDINNEIVVNTPVLTGYLRGSYFAAVGQMPAGQGSPGRGVAAANAVAATLKAGDVYYFGNTAKYARRLELGFVGVDSLGRSYNQMGRFYMRDVLARASDIAMAAANRVAAQT